MKNHLAFWLRFSVFNFLLVAVLGTLMRYKIALSLPFLDQKYLQESHSHFAFYGWITQIIYVFIVDYLYSFVEMEKLRKYKKLFILNAVASYLMLVMFLIGGYFLGSILASTMAMVVSFWFFKYLYTDLKPLKDSTKRWLLAAFFFSLISYCGVLTLGGMKATHHLNQSVYLSATYFYLHFQYNGFFIFSCIAFLLNFLKKNGIQISDPENKTLFRLSFFGTLVGYGLSVLWLPLPLWLVLIIAVSSLSQTLGALGVLNFVRRSYSQLRPSLPPIQRTILLYVGVAFLIKIILQGLLNFPEIARLGFGLRHIVIAYLHLVLLVCISPFLLHQLLATNLFSPTKALRRSVIFILWGIFLNEIILAAMGFCSMFYIVIPRTPEMLVVVSLFIAVSIAMLLFSLKKR